MSEAKLLHWQIMNGPPFWKIKTRTLTIISALPEIASIALPSTFLMFVPFLYHLILQDATLATLLVRPSGLYLEDISNETMLSDKNYGSVNRVYIISKQDKLYTEDYQRWIIENNPPKEVKEIEGSDHMLMLSKPLELCNCLLEIAEKYA